MIQAQQQFTRLTVVKRSGSSKNRCSTWLCKCICGNEIITTSYSLTSEHTKSCGCLQKEITSNRTRLAPGIADFNKIWHSYNRNATNRNIYFELTELEFKDLISNLCSYCGLKPKKYNGIDRVKNSVGYIKSNCVSCCYKCNSFKSNFSLEEFLEHVKQISLFNKDK